MVSISSLLFPCILLSSALQTNYVGVGEPFTVTVNVFNVGDGDATDVVVTDEWSSEYFSHVEGDQVKKLDTLAAGESVELNTTYIPKSEGQVRRVCVCIIDVVVSCGL
jgi:hypothetical protein